VKKQLILTVCGLILVILLFKFGKTDVPKSNTGMPAPTTARSTFNIDQFIEKAKQSLTPSQALTLGKLENSVKRGDVNTQLIAANTQLANFWKDSLHSFEPYAFYLSEAAKLDKSEKNLTFAAQLILDDLRGETDEAKLNWKAAEAIDLFERAIALNPENDDLKIGLGSCYVFGKGRFGGPEETMKGIQQLLAVIHKDSTNMKAQLALGVGGFVSGQYDKALERLQKVVKAQPDNAEAVTYLAQTYEAKGDLVNARKWFEISKRLVNDLQYSKEIDDHLSQMR
jgi:tetratricopeptide (TPR) repeat protein